MTYHTPDYVADLFDVSVSFVMRRVRSGEFPHLRLGKTTRFTDEHIAAIVAAHEVAPDASVNPYGRKTRRAS